MLKFSTIENSYLYSFKEVYSIYKSLKPVMVLIFCDQEKPLLVTLKAHIVYYDAKLKQFCVPMHDDDDIFVLANGAEQLFIPPLFNKPFEKLRDIVITHNKK